MQHSSKSNCPRAVPLATSEMLTQQHDACKRNSNSLLASCALSFCRMDRWLALPSVSRASKGPPVGRDGNRPGGCCFLRGVTKNIVASCCFLSLLTDSQHSCKVAAPIFGSVAAFVVLVARFASGFDNGIRQAETVRDPNSRKRHVRVNVCRPSSRPSSEARFLLVTRLLAHRGLQAVESQARVGKDFNTNCLRNALRHHDGAGIGSSFTSCRFQVAGPYSGWQQRPWSGAALRSPEAGSRRPRSEAMRCEACGRSA